MSLLVLTHAIAATVALLIGPIWMFCKSEKSIFRHILYLWIFLMIVVSITSFWIRDINPGKLSYIHILSAVTLLSIVQFGYFLKKGGDIWLSSKKTLHGVYIGLVLAFLGTLIPGRLMGGIFSERPLLYGTFFVVYFLLVSHFLRKKS